MSNLAYYAVLSDVARCGPITAGWISKACAITAHSGYLDALMMLRKKNGCPWDGSDIHWAHERDYLDAVEWARNNGCFARIEPKDFIDFMEAMELLVDEPRQDPVFRIIARSYNRLDRLCLETSLHA
jgi:hypothetical protein